MNEQQLAAVKQALEALRGLASDTGKFENEVPAITALQSIISQDALDKKAENARELGLDYEPAPVQEPVADAMARYLRVCSSGGMPKKLQESVQNLVYDAERLGYFKATTSPAQPAVQDAEGENKAVRSFLMLYGQPGLTVGQMKKHMAMSGFKAWPAWVETEHHGAHLTKAGAQLWIRHLFALEAAPHAQPAVQEPVVQNICIKCANADSWGLPDKPVCRSCVGNSEWKPLNKSSVNPITPPAAPVQEPGREPVAFKVIRGELCYKSQDDDQSYGMWCPVTSQTGLPYVDGTEFYTDPPAAQQAVPEGWKLVPVELTDEMLAVCDEDVGSKIIDGPAFAVAVWMSFLAAAPEKGQP